MSLKGHRVGPDRRTAGHGDEDVAQIITVDFPARNVTDWGLSRFERAAARCEREAARQPGEIAATLRRVADKYRQQGRDAV